MSNQRQEILSQLNGLLIEAVQTKNIELLKFFTTQDPVIAQKGIDNCLARLAEEQERCEENLMLEEEKLLIAHGVEGCLKEIGNEYEFRYSPNKIDNEKSFNEYFKSLGESVESALNSYCIRFQEIVGKLGIFKSEELIYWKGLAFSTSGLNKRILGQPHYYSATLPNQQTKFLREHFMLGDSQPNLTTLGITDKESFVKQLLSAASTSQYRQVLGSEIQSVLMALSANSSDEEQLRNIPSSTRAIVNSGSSPNAIVKQFENSASELLTVEWKKLYVELKQKRQEIETYVREIKAILNANDSRTGYLELDAKLLLKWLPRNKSSRIIVPDSALRQALQEEEEILRRIKDYCSREDIVRRYVEEYRHDNQLWLGKSSAKLCAETNDLSLFCFDYVHGQHEVPTIRYDETYSRISPTATRTLYLLYRDNQKVNLLVEKNENDKDNEFYVLQIQEQIRDEIEKHLRREIVKTPTYESYLDGVRENHQKSRKNIEAQIKRYKMHQKDVSERIKHYEKIKEARDGFIQRLQIEPAKEGIKKSIETALKGTLSDIGFVRHVRSIAVLPDEIRDHYRNTLLTIAVKNKEKRVMQYLMEVGASLHSRNSLHETPLMLIAQLVGFNNENTLFFEALTYAHKEAKPYLKEIENVFETLVIFSKNITSNFAEILKKYKTMQHHRLNDFWDKLFREISKGFSADLTNERAMNLAKAYDILVNNEKTHNYALMLGDLARLLVEMEKKGCTEDSWLYGGIEYIKEKGDKWMIVHGENYHQEYDTYRRMVEWDIKELKENWQRENKELNNRILQQAEERKKEKAAQDTEIAELKNDHNNKIAELKNDKVQQDTKIAEQGKEIEQLKLGLQAVMEQLKSQRQGESKNKPEADAETATAEEASSSPSSHFFSQAKS